MADLALVGQDGRVVPGAEIAKPVKAKIEQAREYRKRLEPNWQLQLAYARGQHWTVLSGNRLLRRIEDVDDYYRDRELYSADKINEYRMLALGELGSSDDRPELLLEHEDATGEDYQAQANRALAYAWDNEFDGDEALAEVDRLCIDLGTAAIRCRWDPSAGAVREENVPHMDGKPILSAEDAHKAVAEAAGAGKTLEFKTVHEGRHVWEPLSPLQFLTPPGVHHERKFPWVVVVEPTPIATVREEYGDVSLSLNEDGDIGTTLGTSVDSSTSDSVSYGLGEGRQTRLREHIWIYLFYEQPTPRYKQGRVLHFGGNELKLLRIEDKLPYCRKNERGEPVEWRSGVVFFHWWRVSGRFHARSLIEAIKDPQWMLNKRGTQINEIIDRGMPYVLVPEGPQEAALKETSRPMEVVPYPVGQGTPTPVPGIAPGAYMNEDRQRLLEDMEQAAGIRSPSLGENPENVQTYSQLARISEADQVKRAPMQRDRRLAIRQLVENAVYDISEYWGAEKHIALAGDEERVEAHTFDATKLPPTFIVAPAKGAAKPRSQAAELTKIEQLWNAALQSGLVPMDPGAWVTWYAESLEAGEAQDLPPDPSDDQAERAVQENHALLEGQEAPVAYFDNAEVHIPIHRGEQINCLATQDWQAAARIEMHVQEHLQVAQEQMQAAAAEQADLPGESVIPNPAEGERAANEPEPAAEPQA